MENKGLELAQQLGDYVNTYAIKDKSKDFIDGFCRQHRTLQQSSFRLIMELIEHMASDEYRTDGRNEGSKQVAQKLLAGFKAEGYKELIDMGVSPESAKRDIESEHYLPSKFLRFI